METQAEDRIKNTLQEPVYKTFLRELRFIGVKMFFVLVPINRKVNILANCTYQHSHRLLQGIYGDLSSFA